MLLNGSINSKKNNYFYFRLITWKNSGSRDGSSGKLHWTTLVEQNANLVNIPFWLLWQKHLIVESKYISFKFEFICLK